MKLATYNLNGIRARLPRLLEWLEREKPDVVCLQELKCADESLPIADIEARRLWRGLARAEGLQRRRDPCPRRCAGASARRPSGRSRRHAQPLYRGRGAGGVIVASLYLPNGNPVGTEKFDYKFRWMERLWEHSRELLAEERPVVLAGDWNVVPEDRDVFSVRATPARCGDAAGSARCVAADRQPGLDRRPARAPPATRRSSTPSGTIPPAAGSATSASASTICCARPKRRTGCAAPTSTVGARRGEGSATTRRRGSSLSSRA